MEKRNCVVVSKRFGLIRLFIFDRIFDLFLKNEHDAHDFVSVSSIATARGKNKCYD